MNKYKQYAEIKQQIKELEQQAKQLQDELFADLIEIDGNKLETDHGTFSIMYRTSYTYSSELTEKEKAVKKKLKEMKAKEELSGVATVNKQTGYVRLQAAK